MYEIGDSVMLKGFEKQIVGKIVSYHYDEGNVWVVRTEGGNLWDCADHELSPAVDAYGHPWSSQEKEWNKTEDILQDRYPLQGG
jgi:hypothetical protein